MRRLLLALFLLVSNQTGAADKPRDPQQYFFNESFWDFTEELQTARDSGERGILIMFEMDECPFGRRMKSTILNQPDVQDYFRQHFMIFAVDVEGDVEIVDFSGKTTTMKDFAFKQFRVSDVDVLGLEAAGLGHGPVYELVVELRPAPDRPLRVGEGVVLHLD